jgi:carotenoid cleavage dioxygenase-like enzyme
VILKEIGWLMMTSAHFAPFQPGRSLTRLGLPLSGEMIDGALPVDGHLPETLDGVSIRIGPHGASGQPLSGGPVVSALRLRDGRAEWAGRKWLRTDRVSRALGQLPAPGFSAHPERDPVTGEMFAVAYYHEAPYAQHIIADAGGRVRRVEPISVKDASMMHAYSLTEHYAVLYDLPVVFSPAAAAAGIRVPYAWDDTYGARLGILPREGADRDVRWIEIEPCYVFHAMNAYETGDDRLVLDVVRHERAFDREPAGPGENPPALWRWTVGLHGGGVHEEQLDDRPQELPAVDERFKGCACRYGLTTEMSSGSAPYGGRSLLRHNLPSGTTEIHDFGPGARAGNPVFVPRSPEAQEGDGWVMTLVRRIGDGASRLVVLDTADFSGDPVAVIWLPPSSPRGFHTTWLSMG